MKQKKDKTNKIAVAQDDADNIKIEAEQMIPEEQRNLSQSAEHDTKKNKKIRKSNATKVPRVKKNDIASEERVAKIEEEGDPIIHYEEENNQVILTAKEMHALVENEIFENQKLSINSITFEDLKDYIDNFQGDNGNRGVIIFLNDAGHKIKQIDSHSINNITEECFQVLINEIKQYASRRALNIYCKNKGGKYGTFSIGTTKDCQFKELAAGKKFLEAIKNLAHSVKNAISGINNPNRWTQRGSQLSQGRKVVKNFLNDLNGAEKGNLLELPNEVAVNRFLVKRNGFNINMPIVEKYKLFLGTKFDLYEQQVRELQEQKDQIRQNKQDYELFMQNLEQKKSSMCKMFKRMTTGISVNLPVRQLSIVF